MKSKRKTEKNILIAFLLNLLFSVVELIGGIITNSVAIISDAVHDFGDSVSIGISYFLERKSKRKPDDKYTYGYVRYSVLGAIVTNTILIIGSTLVIYNAIVRFINPSEIDYNGMIIFAIFGVIINFIAAKITNHGNSLNQKAVNLHMLEDVLGWIVVLIGAIFIKFTGFYIIDSIMSILVALFILFNALKSYKSIVDLFLEKTPSNISVEDLKKHLIKIEGVEDIHHIHIWSIDGFHNYVTLHVVTNSNDFKKLKNLIKNELKEHGITHTTVEFEELGELCNEMECVVSDYKHSHHHHH